MTTLPAVTRQMLEVFAGIGAVLVVASAVGWTLKKVVAGGATNAVIDNLNARIRSWWVMVAIVAMAFAAGHLGVTLLFAFLSVAALREFVRVIAVRSDARGRTVSMHAGVILCVLCLWHAPALLTIRIRGYEDRALMLVLFLLVIVQSSDVLQYIWGKLLGRRQVAPNVSPSKTWAGLVGGVVSATALGAVLAPITPFTPAEAALLALVVTSCGFCGGLLLSAIKRAHGAKDWGGLIRGHGGVLDRVDSVVLAAPVFFYATRFGWA